MASTYTNSGLEIIGSGEQEASWGTTTSTNLKLLDKSIAQRQVIAQADGDSTITVADGILSATDNRAAYLKFEGTLTANRTVTIAPDDMQRLYIIENATTGGFGIIIKQGTGATVSIAFGAIATIYLDGEGAAAAVFRLASYKSGVENSIYATAGEMFPRQSQQAGGDNEYVDDNAVSGGDTTTLIFQPTIEDATVSYRAVRTWTFDDAGSEYVMFEKKMPADWDGGVLTFMPIWSPRTATSGATQWKMQAVSYEEGFDWDNDSWSSNEGYVNATAVAATTIVRGPQSSETVPAIDGQFTAGAPAGAGDVVLFSIQRNASVGADSMTGDALLHGVYVFYNQSADCTC